MCATYTLLPDSSTLIEKTDHSVRVVPLLPKYLQYARYAEDYVNPDENADEDMSGDEDEDASPEAADAFTGNPRTEAPAGVATRATSSNTQADKFKLATRAAKVASSSSHIEHASLVEHDLEKMKVLAFDDFSRVVLGVPSTWMQDNEKTVLKIVSDDAFKSMLKLYVRGIDYDEDKHMLMKQLFRALLDGVVRAVVEAFPSPLPESKSEDNSEGLEGRSGQSASAANDVSDSNVLSTTLLNFIEFKLDDFSVIRAPQDGTYTKDHLRAAGRALECFSAEPWLSHVVGALVTATHIEFLYYDRSIIVHSVPLDFRTDPLSFVSAVYGLFRLFKETQAQPSFIVRSANSA
ncbi:hypothetical protein EIP91_005526 [Steccherinum ochraceum]|uniref:Fungal-type protein kinase domain-containing protein n=1 Tax=Steccherinum ochraceum TaxID=92696 RepID=A0A4R0RS48_9APHY|nr:hypothetical protein EIP91_005526 [Steccherinum ochraceum]